jgi:hypothetical protein
MDLVVFSLVLILMIFAAFGLAIWAAVGEERWMQTSWCLRVHAPTASSVPAPTEPVSRTPAVGTATAVHAPSAAVVSAS